MQDATLIQIARDFGSPVYVYDAATIERQYKRLEAAFAPKRNRFRDSENTQTAADNAQARELRIHYAVKALSNVAIIKFLNELGARMDTVSKQEVLLALAAGVEPSHIIYTPNGVSLLEIEEVAAMGVQVNIDNLSILEQFGSRNPTVPVCVRINPHVMAGGNANISVGHIDSKFGISIHQIPHLLRIVENTGMRVNGVHMHTGSDILDIGVFLYATEILFETAAHFPNLEFIDFGSGFKVPYKEGDVSTDIEELGEQLSARFDAFVQSYGKEVAIAFEPGKFLVSEAGHFVTQVNVVKQTTSTVFAGVDSGMNHLMRPMLYGSYHNIRNLSHPDGRKRFYSVVGYICETDTFGNNRQIAEITEGDLLAFSNAGAYCFSMASNYNSRYRPAEVLWLNGKAHLIRERETMDDILRGQVAVTA